MAIGSALKATDMVLLEVVGATVLHRFHSCGKTVVAIEDKTESEV